MQNDTNITKSVSEEIAIEEIEEISPHNKALYEAGKSMLTDSLSTGREFCKSMITTSTGAIPIYLGILVFIFPEHYVLGVWASLLVALPAIAFLLSSIIFTVGYLPIIAKFSLDIVDEIDNERNRILHRRNNVIKVGFSIFVLGVLLAIFVIIVNIGVR